LHRSPATHALPLHSQMPVVLLQNAPDAGSPHCVSDVQRQRVPLVWQVRPIEKQSASQPPHVPVAAASQPLSASGKNGWTQLTKPALQYEVHRPEEHSSVITFVVAHVRPQPPQFRMSPSTFLSQPLSVDGGFGPSQSAQPKLHECVHTPPLQYCAALFVDLHATPQPPQCAGLLGAISQPLVGTPSQFLYPLLQVSPHWPPMQVAVENCPYGHALLQAPQCAGFEVVSTHWPPQLVVPPVQFSVQTPFAHT
jgi:hypothetical protein